MDYEKDNAFCTLLEFGNLKVLLDCGIDSSFDVTNYENYEK